MEALPLHALVGTSAGAADQHAEADATFAAAPRRSRASGRAQAPDATAGSAVHDARRRGCGLNAPCTAKVKAPRSLRNQSSLADHQHRGRDSSARVRKGRKDALGRGGRARGAAPQGTQSGGNAPGRVAFLSCSPVLSSCSPTALLSCFPFLLLSPAALPLLSSSSPPLLLSRSLPAPALLVLSSSSRSALLSSRSSCSPRLLLTRRGTQTEVAGIAGQQSTVALVGCRKKARKLSPPRRETVLARGKPWEPAAPASMLSDVLEPDCFKDMAASGVIPGLL